MFNITVVNRKTYKGDGEWVCRKKSPLGNPFAMKDESQRTEVIAQYRRWLWDVLSDEVTTSAKVEFKRLVNLAKQQDLILICFCAPLPCHGDVIKSAIKWYIDSENTMKGDK